MKTNLCEIFAILPTILIEPNTVFDMGKIRKVIFCLYHHQLSFKILGKLITLQTL